MRQFKNYWNSDIHTNDIIIFTDASADSLTRFNKETGIFDQTKNSHHCGMGYSIVRKNQTTNTPNYENLLTKHFPLGNHDVNFDEIAAITSSLTEIKKGFSRFNSYNRRIHIFTDSANAFELLTNKSSSKKYNEIVYDTFTIGEKLHKNMKYKIVINKIPSHCGVEHLIFVKGDGNELADTEADKGRKLVIKVKNNSILFFSTIPNLNQIRKQIFDHSIEFINGIMKVFPQTPVKGIKEGMKHSHFLQKRDKHIQW